MTDSIISKKWTGRTSGKRKNKPKESFGLLCICAKENTVIANRGLSYVEQDYLFNPRRLSTKKTDKKLAKAPTAILLNNGEAYSLMTSNFSGPTYGEGARSIPKGHYDTFLDRQSFHFTAMREFMEETKLTHKNFPYYMKLIAENELMDGIEGGIKQKTTKQRRVEKSRIQPPRIPPSLSCDNGDIDVDPNMLFDPENQLTDCIYGLDHNPYKTRYFVYVVENENCLDVISWNKMNNILMLNQNKGRKGRRYRKKNYFSSKLDSHKEVERVSIDELPDMLYRDKFKVSEKICMEKLYSIIKKYREKNKYKIVGTGTGITEKKKDTKETTTSAISNFTTLY